LCTSSSRVSTDSWRPVSAGRPATRSTTRRSRDPEEGAGSAVSRLGSPALAPPFCPG
jgi:hypothetical protein